MQMQMSAYPYRYSVRFVASYGRAFEHLLARCNAGCVSHDRRWGNCPMRR